MLQGIITDDFGNKYYLNTNGNSFNVVLSNMNVTKYLSKEEATNLILNIFSNDMRYLYDKDNYSIFLDELNNKRFFKGNIEDLHMLFSYNGKSPILYNGDSEINDEGKEVTVKSNNNKLFRIIMTNTAISAVSALVMSLLIKNGVIDLGYFASEAYLDRRLNYSIDYTYDQQLDYEYKIIEERDLTVNEMIMYIMNSNELSDIDKKVLVNPKLFEDILSVADKSRDYELRYKLTHLDIKSIKPIIKGTTTTEGYYNPLHPGMLYVTNERPYDEVDEEGRDLATIAHEYVHLLQNNGRYLNIITDGSNNILVNEYFGYTVYSYPSEMKRVKVLMEIIGPEEVFDANFTTVTPLREEISSLLTKNETILFFNILQQDLPLKTSDYDKLDNLLAKMYENKYHEDISTNEVINLIYEGKDKILNKKYFNKNENSNYIEDIVNFDEKYGIDCYVLEKVDKEATQEEFEAYDGEKAITIKFKEGYEEDFKTHRIKEIGKEINDDYPGYEVYEAYEMGLILPNQYIIYEEKLTKTESILSLIKNDKLSVDSINNYKFYTNGEEIKTEYKDGKILFEKPEGFINSKSSDIKK